MERISLYDKDNDKMYDVMLSSEDARRAAADITYGTRLLNAAILEENRNEQNEIIPVGQVCSNRFWQGLLQIIVSKKATNWVQKLLFPIKLAD
ncbi:hypothetical protein ACS0PU_010429 [Formica fusca]